MRLATLKLDGRESGALRLAGGYLPLADLNRLTGADWPTDLLALIQGGRLDDLRAWHDRVGARELADRAGLIAPEQAAFGPLYRQPGKIWGIGLNYAAHAADLDEKAPTLAPASFMKPATTIIGPGDTIPIPHQSHKTTAEAELGLVFGRRCKDVALADWRQVLAGFTTIIDMTAEDILRQNPRYLTLSKSFDGFFGFGPELVTPDEVARVEDLVVRTVHNGRVHAANQVANMTFPPDRLVAFHSAVMTMLPGDVISTGTPGAAPIAHGDRVECLIDGFAPLANPVVDLKAV